MANLKVAQLRMTLFAFARLYRGAQDTEAAEVLEALCRLMEKVDKQTVDDFALAIKKAGRSEAH